MNSEQHYAEAERLVEIAKSRSEGDLDLAAADMAAAQVHATLATIRPAEPSKPSASSKADWDAARLLVKMARGVEVQGDVEYLVSRSHPAGAQIAHLARVEADKVDSYETAGEGVSPQVEAAIVRLGLDATR